MDLDSDEEELESDSEDDMSDAESQSGNFKAQFEDDSDIDNSVDLNRFSSS